MGFFDVPTVERKPWGILGLVLNIVPYAGVGSILVGAKEGHRNTLIRGIIQLLTGWLVVGWIWSIVDGIRIFNASTAHAAPIVFREVPAPAVAAKPTPKAAAKSAPKKAAAKKSAKKSAKKA